MLSEIQEVLYFPIRRTTVINTVGATIPFDSGEVDLTCLCAYARLHSCMSILYTSYFLKIALCSLAFIQACSAVAPEKRGEMISQVLTDLLPRLEAAFKGAFE